MGMVNQSKQRFANSAIQGWAGKGELARTKIEFRIARRDFGGSTDMV